MTATQSAPPQKKGHSVEAATIHPADEMDALWRSGSSQVVERIHALATALAAQDGQAEYDATMALAEAVSMSMTYANLVARHRVILEVDAMAGDGSLDLSDRVIFAELDPMLFAFELPKVPFWKAIKRLLSREPRLARTAEAVAEHYRSGDGFAAAWAATVNVAKRVRNAIADLMTTGTTVPDAAQVIAETEGWTEAYAENVYRTNIATAYSEGRREQATTPEAKKVIGAFMISVTDDADLRRGRKKDHGENHKAAEGLLASTTDPIWATVSPPFGYQCRCVQLLVSRMRLKRDGLLSDTGEVVRYHPKGLEWFRANFKPHPNFGKG